MTSLRYFLVCATLASASQAAFPLAIELTPGLLQAHLPEIQHTSDAILILSGTADVRDLSLLPRMSRSITTVDLSALEISAYTYPQGNWHGKTVFAANTLPSYSLAGTSVQEIKFPLAIEGIGEAAFSASALTSVTVPASVTSIGNNAFAACANLENAVVESQVFSSLGSNIFKDCTMLKKVDFTVWPLIMPEGIFYGCSSLNLPVPSQTRRIEANAWRGTALTIADLTFTESVGDYAFAQIPTLTEIILPAGGIYAGNGVFYNDTNLTSLPNWEGTTGDALFCGTSASTVGEINSPEIGEGAYANNSRLDSITFGPAVRRVGAYAFRNTKSLKSVNAVRLGANVPEVDSTSFSGLENEEGRYDIPLYVAANTETDWEKAPVWNLFNITHGAVGIQESPIGGIETSAFLNGGILTVESNADINNVKVYSSAGALLTDINTNGMHIDIDGMPQGEVLLVKVATGNTIHIFKVV